ncbi:MAG TPA: SRPBCC domain-containing protein [Acidimicrobiia bacterium]|nr:SRPBCC domain-containing protein [Acidimicrobiia bacterium]
MRGSFQRSALLAVSLEDVWAGLHDVDRLASYSTHLGPVENIDPGERWKTSLQDRVGLVKLSAPMEVAIVEETHGERISIHATGRDKGPGTRLVVEATVRLTESGPDTELDLEGTYELTGRATRLGAAVARRQAESMVEEFWANLTTDLVQ